MRDQLEKRSGDSKKWRMAMIGLKGVAGMFVSGMLAFLFVPALAPHITTLVQFGLTAWGGIVSVYLGAQGSVEFKTTAALQNLHETKEEHVEITERTEGGAKAFEDEGEAS